MRNKVSEDNELNFLIEETKTFDKSVIDVYNIACGEVFNRLDSPDIALYAYGSPGRIELVGGDSDADLLLVEREGKSEQFKDSLKRKLSLLGFSKVDMPTWSKLEEILLYLSKSIVEGNQVAETRFLVGDKQLSIDFERERGNFNSIERMYANVVFNRLYLNQYFRQRVRDGFPNIKYCSGGSRDFLFFGWFEEIERIMNNRDQDNSYKPKIQKGLDILNDYGVLSSEDYSDAIAAISFLSKLRGDVLRVNRETEDRGVTVLDDETIKRLENRGYNTVNIKTNFETHRKLISKLSDLVWGEIIKKMMVTRGNQFGVLFKRAYNINLSESDRLVIPTDDRLLRIASIWGASESNQVYAFNEFARKHRETEDWATIGSFVCSPLCSPELLYHFASGVASQKGYGYLLRIIARNKNVDRETLMAIVNNQKLDERYTEVAVAALEGGYRKANNQL